MYDVEETKVPPYIVATAERKSNMEYHSSFTKEQHELAGRIYMEASKCDGRTYQPVCQKKFIRIKLSLDNIKFRSGIQMDKLMSVCKDNNVEMVIDGKTILMRVRK